MSVASEVFKEYANQALSQVEDKKLVSVLMSGFEKNIARLNEYGETYQLITSKNWSQESLSVFFCGWRNPDGAAHAVSSIMIRLLQESDSIESVQGKLLMHEAARNCGEIIIEDVGLGELNNHPHHSKLYYKMATTICGSDNWRKQEVYLDPNTRIFSTWVGAKRPLAKDLMEAIEMMIWTELFNTGEYNLMTPMWKQWIHEYAGFPQKEVGRIAAFLSVHCGAVEARHFIHAANALLLYAKATNREINYERIEHLSNEYVVNACVHLKRMASVLVEESLELAS